MRGQSISDHVNATDVTTVPVGTSFFQQRYLFGFAGQAEVSVYLRTQAAKEEAVRIPEIMDAWAQSQSRVQHLLSSEAGAAESILIDDLPTEKAEYVQRIKNSDLFQKTFQHQIVFASVEIDKLVAAQRTVNLDYVDRIKASLPDEPKTDEIYDTCLSLERAMNPIQHLELGPNAHVFSSPSTDLRFLGAFEKRLTQEDLAYAQTGGLPAAAIISFVGYGASPVNVFVSNGRVVLNNGFHRVYALRAKGITKIPVVMQVANNAALEFPPTIAGISRDYLLGHPRPVLMKDFFDPDLSTTIKVQNRIRVVTLQVNAGQHDVPT